MKITKSESSLQKTLSTRQPGTNIGSAFDRPVTIEELKSFDWEPYSHPDVAPPAVSFKTEDVGGTFGIHERDDGKDGQ